MNKLKSRELFYYLGRDEEHNYIATPLSNMIIAGQTGSGKTTLLNNILVKLVQECNPNEIIINWYDCKGSEIQSWLDCIPQGRELPHFGEMRKFSSEDSAQAIETLLEIEVELSKRIRFVQTASTEELQTTECKNLVFIFDEYQAVVDESREFETILKRIVPISEQVGIYIILCSQSHYGSLLDSTVELFTTRVCTPLRSTGTEQISNLYLGSNCAFMETAYCGVIWYKYKNRFPRRLYVPFYPYTWIKKLIRSYSVSKGIVEI